MPTRDIKTRFKLEGEQEFKRAMSDAASAVKVLNSEEKLAKAQFEATGDAQQYAADQARSLKEQIEQQKKAVKAAEDAIKALTEHGVDKNSTQMQKWRTKLNNAKTSLTQMQTRLDKVGTELSEEETGFKNAETAGRNFQSGMEEVAKGINLANAITAIDNVKEHIEAIVRGAAKAAKAMWDMGVEGSKWADDLATAANVAGIDVETYQSWQYASRFIDTSVDDIVKNFKDIDNNFSAGGDTLRDYQALLAEIGIASAKSDDGMRFTQDTFFNLIDYLHNIKDETERTKHAVKLFGDDWEKLNPLIKVGSAGFKEAEKNGGKTLKQYQAIMAELGVSTQKTAVSMRSGQEIFWDLIDYLHNIGDDTERTRQAIKLFGNDWRKLNPLITEGSAAYKEMAEQGRSVAVVSAENVSALESMNDSYEDMQARLTTFQMDALSALAPTFNQVADALSKAITAMDDFVKSKEGQAALSELNDAMSGLIKAFLGDDNGQGTFESIVTGAKDAVTKLTDALTWLKDNGQTVKKIIMGMAVAWAGLTVSKEVLTFIMLLRALPLDKLSALFTGGKGLTGATGGGALGGGGGNVAGPVPTSAKTAGSGLIAGFKHIAGAAAPYLATAAVTAGFGALMDKWSTEKNYGQYNNIIEQMQTAMGYASDKAEELRQNILKLREAWGQGSGEGVTAGREFFAANAAQIYAQMPDLAIFERWKDVFGEVGDFSPEKMQKFIGVFDPETGIWDSTATFASHWEDFIREYTEHAAVLAETAEEQGEAASEALATGLEETAGEAMEQAEIAGENVSIGMANGIYEKSDEAEKAARYLAARVAAGCSQLLMIHSPSRVFEQFGEYVGEGFAMGIDESTGAVDAAMGRMMSVTTRRPVRGRGSANESAGTGMGAGDMVHVTLVLDDEVLGDVMAPIINDKIGARIAATRR